MNSSTEGTSVEYVASQPSAHVRHSNSDVGILTVMSSCIRFWKHLPPAGNLLFTLCLKLLKTTGTPPRQWRIQDCPQREADPPRMVVYSIFCQFFSWNREKFICRAMEPLRQRVFVIWHKVNRWQCFQTNWISWKSYIEFFIWMGTASFCSLTLLHFSSTSLILWYYFHTQ